MADLLQSLLTTQLQRQAEANMHPEALPAGEPDVLADAAGVDRIFVDADEYLQDVSASPSDSLAIKNGLSTIPPTMQPVQIGQPRTSEHCSALHKLAQEKKISVEFVYEERTLHQFSVTLTLGGQRVVEEPGPWPSKKAAKEAVCAKGYQVLKAMKGVSASQPGENWVGMLQEYYVNKDDGRPHHSYTEFSVGTLFACEVVIDEHASAPFGSRFSTFTNKKAAKTNAAREAVQWLKENNFMGSQGPPTRKKRKTSSSSGAAMPVSGETVEIKRAATFAQKVNDLCPKIGLTPPEYRLSPDPQFNSMYSGAAYFNDPIIPSRPIGDVRNVYGRKNAKEEVAKAVLSFLKEWTKKQDIELREKE